MTEIKQILNEAVQKHLDQNNLEIAGVIPIPSTGDKWVRLRALEGFLEEFMDELEKSDSSGNPGYLLQIKPKTQIAKEPLPDPETLVQEDIYLPTGKLNTIFLFKNAEVLLQSGEYALARKLCRNILLSGDSTQTAFYWIGRCFEREEKFTESITNYQESIAYEPNLETYKRLSALLIRENRNEEAVDTLNRALKLCATADDLRKDLGTLYLKMNRITEAKKQFREVLASNSRNCLAMTGLGTCLFFEGDYLSAQDCLVKSLELEINQATAIFYLVKCAHALKSYATACQLLKGYIAKAPKNPSILYSMAGLEFHLGRVEDVKKTANQILKIQANHVGAKELLELTERF